MTSEEDTATPDTQRDLQMPIPGQATLLGGVLCTNRRSVHVTAVADHQPGHTD
jgi:hypothetical protein